MIFQFPDLETLRLAITSAQIPSDVSAAPAEVAFDPAGRPSVRPVAGIPPKPMLNALKKLGVKQARDHYTEATLTVECWPQVLPVHKSPAVPEVTSNTPVLFDMPSADMPAVVTEMLRLGNDRQSFRTVAGNDGDRVLLKVIGPPYYTLLRAIDKTTQKGATVTAYVERASRVWVELGYDHPMATQIKPADGQVLLLRPEREWTAVEDGPFQDVYDVLDFKLPAASVEWQESQLKGKLSVPLKLVPGNAADVAELWVLTEEAVDQLDALVRDADERLMARLSFAVAHENGQTTIVLKTRPSKLSPPVLPLAKARAFKPYWKLPNLFLPVGKRLMPTLRRDAVRKLLADDPAQVVWLMPNVGGKFTPEVLPDDAFRPLEDWIDYVIDHEHEKLAAWVQATHFDFDSFICRDDQADKPKPPQTDKGKKNKKDRGAGPDDEADLPPPVPKAGRKKSSAADETDFQAPVEVAPPNELRVRLRELEDRFKAVDGPLDDPERVALWPEMARLNTALKNKSDAAVCWTNAYWELPDAPAEGSRAWLRTEDPDARPIPTAEEWDTALAANLPSPEAVRGFAARVVHACRQDPVPDSFLKRLPRVREYLEKHENVLGVRVIWLAWWHLAGAGGAAEDVKAVAHVRDRLLQRLLAEGLNKERDLPYFLRTAGAQDSERTRLVRDKALKLHGLVEQWHAGEDVKVNKPYVDLMFAFGLAKLGEFTAARDLVNGALGLLLNGWNTNAILQRPHEILGKAFAWRIENVLAGKPHAGPLPDAIRDQIKEIDRGRGEGGINPKYIVDRMIEQSWILEPEEAVDPYNQFITSGPLAERRQFESLTDPRALRAAVDRLLGSNHDAVTLVGLLNSAANFVHRAGETYAIKFVQSVPGKVFSQAVPANAPDTTIVNTRMQRASLLSRMIFIAAHYGRPELVDRNLDLVYQVLNEKTGQERYEILNLFAHRAIRELRRLGLKDQVDRLLRQIRDLVVQGKSLAQLQHESSGPNWGNVLGSLLCLAEGWQYFGAFAEARTHLDAGRATIANNPSQPVGRRLGPKDLTSLVQRYVVAAGVGPIDEALNRIEDLFRILERLPNSYSTASHYSRLHLNVVEELVRTFMSENLALGDQARRWLDDDEYLVRRRIHGDMRRLLAQSGL